MTLSIGRYAEVLLDGRLAGRYPYRVASGQTVQRGAWAIVPWGHERRIGIVATLTESVTLDPAKVRDLEGIVEDLPVMASDWFDLLDFAATYYHVDPAVLALSGVPRQLRTPPRARARISVASRLESFKRLSAQATGPTALRHPLTAEQHNLVTELANRRGACKPLLLHGVTGSGKTEVYLSWIEQTLIRTGDAQALLLVPEIGLTPALRELIRARFSDQPIAVLHSDMPEAERASHWLAAATGIARIVIGTRSAAWVPLPRLAAIIVDEEHDGSFKQQEGTRFSARDLAVTRARLAQVPIVLGSATPSLESWHNAQRGRYELRCLTARPSRQQRRRHSGHDRSPFWAPVSPTLTRIELVSMNREPLRHGLVGPVIEAVAAALNRGEQALVYLNRRGYSPVLSCPSCGWLSRCDQCDAYRVLHRLVTSLEQQSRAAAYRLICHHCASERHPPRRCPDCGNQDLSPVGRGTQRLEQGLRALFPNARIARLDRDVANQRGAAAAVLAAAHAGEVDLLLGTQMLVKGHDFERLTQVVVADADSALFASDFRAPERLFATLLQVSGRAGRHRPEQAVTWIQTRHADHPLFDYVRREDYVGFAAAQLTERQAQGLPPYGHQALILARARKPDIALGFLQQARTLLASADGPAPFTSTAAITVCDPVPMPLARFRGEARFQLLLEAIKRPALHQLLNRSQAALAALAASVGRGLSWSLVIDPSEI